MDNQMPTEDLNPEIKIYNKCPHCSATGTCGSGGDNKSCGSCLTLKHRIKGATRVACRVCAGRGYTVRGDHDIKTVTPGVLSLVVIGIFFMASLAAITGTPSRLELVLPAITNLTTFVITYYFASKSK